MKKVIIYPGRFQPMLSHHAEVLRQLQAQFPDADVYVGTSDKVQEPKSPFNFAEKQLIAQAHGIDPSSVLQANRPYHKDDYPFDQDNTLIIFAVGEKDLDRFPFNNVDPETGLDMTVRGEPKPKYYQKIDTLSQGALPMSDRGYITLAPTVRTGDQVASASAFRQQFKDAPDAESAKQLFTSQFGEYNEKVFNLIYNKIVGTNMNEQMNILRKLAGLPVEEGAPVRMEPGYALSDADRKLADIGRIIMSMANQRPMGKGVPDSEIGFQNTMSDFGGQLADGKIESTADLIDFIKGAGEHAAELSNVVKQAMADYAAGKKADVQGDEVQDDMEEQSEIDSVDLSNFYEDDEEGDQSERAAFDQVLDSAVTSASNYAYGDVSDKDYEEAFEYYKAGQFDAVSDVILNSFSDSDGGEVSEIQMVHDDLLSDLEHIHKQHNPVQESADDAVERAVARFQSVARSHGYYGNIDLGSIQKLVDQGDWKMAAGVVTNGLSDQEGNEAPDQLYDYALKLFGGLSEGIEDQVCPHCDGSGCEECNDVGGDLSEEEMEEAVEETSTNAMQAAMTELRKLAGI